MPRVAQLAAMSFGIWLLAAPSALQSRPDRPERPNIILITAEDLSPRIGAFGDAVAHTPHIDQLAREGIRYTNVFTTSGVCAPSRSALITGVHQQTLGTMHMRTSAFGKDMDHGAPYEAVPPAQVKAFPELLRAAGYYTVNNPKTDYQFGEPFTVWDQSGTAADWKNAPQGKPLFLMINHEYTHESRTWAPGTDPKIHPSVAGVMKQNERGVDALKDFPLTDPARVRVPAYYPDTPAVRANIARVYDNVRVMDGQVGKLLARLKAEGRFEDSIIIFMTDHGDGLPRAKRTVFDSGLRVPVIVRFPDKRGAGSVDNRMVSGVDLAPTLLEIAGIKPPKWVQGKSFLPAKPKQPYIFAAGDRFDEVTQRFKAVRDSRFKYIRYYSRLPLIPSLGYQNVNPIMMELRQLDKAGGLSPLQASYLRDPAPAEMLFDTQADPDEVRNLAGDPLYAKELARLRKALDGWNRSTGDLSALDEAKMVERMWPGGKQPETAEVKACRTKDGKVALSSATLGASLGWRQPDGDWLLYVRPIAGAEVEAKAVRYGYKTTTVSRFTTDRLDRCRG